MCANAAYGEYVWIVTENPVRSKYACSRALLRMPVSKKKADSHEIKKSIALAGLLFCREKSICNKVHVHVQYRPLKS